MKDTILTEMPINELNDLLVSEKDRLNKLNRLDKWVWHDGVTKDNAHAGLWVAWEDGGNGSRFAAG